LVVKCKGTDAPNYNPLEMTALTIFGVVAVTGMLVFYTLEDRGAVYVLLFALTCLLSSVYGFLQGAWPFGVVELVWMGVAVQRWQRRRKAHSPVQRGTH
jgi:hypothetical protein